MDAKAKAVARAEYMRGWRERHRETHREYQRRYMAQYCANPENAARVKARSKAWSSAHLEERNAAARRRYIKKGFQFGERHHGWKGANASYVAIHIWISSRKGRPSECEVCGTTTAKKFEWCNVDHEYVRDVDQYFRACTSCHRCYDYENGLAAKGGRKPRAIPS